MVRVRGGAAVDALVGAEFIASEDTESSARVAVDLHLGFGYRSAADQASGFWLPSALPESRSLAVSRGEHLVVSGGMAVDAFFKKYVGLRIGADGGWISPHRVEHVYEVRTDRKAFSVGWQLALVGRIRTKDDAPGR